jgi:hypothetical protein
MECSKQPECRKGSLASCFAGNSPLKIARHLVVTLLCCRKNRTYSSFLCFGAHYWTPFHRPIPTLPPVSRDHYSILFIYKMNILVPTNEWKMWYLFLYVCLILFNKMTSTSIHVATSDRISFFICLNNVPLSNTNLLSSCSEGQKSKIGLTELKSRVWAGCIYFWRLQGHLCPWPLPVSRGHSASGHMPSSIFRVNTSLSLFASHFHI